jgi:hypothetical protein
VHQIWSLLGKNTASRVCWSDIFLAGALN